MAELVRRIARLALGPQDHLVQHGFEVAAFRGRYQLVEVLRANIRAERKLEVEALDEILERLRGVGDAFDLEPDPGQRRGDLLERRRSFQMLLEPGQRELHGLSPPVRPGWASAAKP